MLACVYGAYLIVSNKLSSGSFDTEVYILGYIYGSVQFTAIIYPIVLQYSTQSPDYILVHLIVGMGRNESSAGTLTTKCVARLVMIILRERMYATAYIVKDLMGLFAGWCWCWFGLAGAVFFLEENTVGWLVWAG